jgi:hypothetical protein
MEYIHLIKMMEGSKSRIVDECGLSDRANS